MNNSKPKLDPTKLTPEQRSQLSAYHQGQAQLQALKDIADMTGEVINLLDKQANQEGIDKLGVLLVDMRESLNQLNAKEAPEQPDTSKPVIDAISKLEKALTAAVSAQKAPVVNVPKADAPVVNVDAPDFSKVEKILKEIPKAFEQAIKGIVIPEQDDAATNALLEGIAEQLGSIDTAVRMQPQAPTTIKVTNPDGSNIGSSVVGSSTPSQSSVSVTNSNTTVLAANATRLGATVYNEGAATCYLKLGATASTTSYTLQVASGGYYELPFNYTGIITGITSSGTAQLRITELA